MTEKLPARKAPWILSLGPIAVGAGLLTVAVLFPVYSTGKIVKASLSEQLTLVSSAVSSEQNSAEEDGAFPAKVIDRCSLSKSSGKAAVLNAKAAMRTYLTVEEPSDGNSLTYQAGTSVLVSEIRSPESEESTSLVPTALPDSQGKTDIELWSDGQCTNGLLKATIDRVTVGRHNGLPIAKGLSEVQIEPRSHSELLANRSGQQYRFPFHTHSTKKYTYFDLTTASSYYATYVDTAEIGGISALHFHVDVPETDLAAATGPPGVDTEHAQFIPGMTLTKPLSWWGIPHITGEDDHMMHRFYTNAIDLYVDSESGVILRNRQNIHEYFAEPVVNREEASPEIKEFELPILSGLFDYDQPTLEATVKQAKAYRDKSALLGRTVPIVAGVTGLILLVGGGIGYYRRAR